MPALTNISQELIGVYETKAMQERLVLDNGCFYLFTRRRNNKNKSKWNKTSVKELSCAEAKEWAFKKCKKDICDQYFPAYGADSYIIYASFERDFGIAYYSGIITDLKGTVLKEYSGAFLTHMEEEAKRAAVKKGLLFIPDGSDIKVIIDTEFNEHEQKNRCSEFKMVRFEIPDMLYMHDAEFECYMKTLDMIEKLREAS